MKKDLIIPMLKTAGCMAAGVILLASCNEEPDDSTLYTFTGFTVEQYLAQHPDLESFNYIVKRAGYDRILESYGGYTVFAPGNDGVQQYIDSLYRDPEKAEENPHNGMADHGTLAEGQHAELEWLTDSLCRDITLYHIAGSSQTGAMPLTIMDMSSDDNNKNVTSLLGRAITITIDNARGPLLNDRVTITNLDEDTETKTAVNGIVHTISDVLPRSNRLVGTQMAKMEGFSIFSEALQKTGLADSLLKTKKEKVAYEKADYDADHLMVPDDEHIDNYESLVKYTVFAESDDVFRAAGINSFADLVTYANSVYANADQWYDYLRQYGLWSETAHDYVKTVSTGTDYTSRNNAVNMFVAYHLLGAGVRSDVITTYFNVVPSGRHGWSGDSYDYYRTMLPNTLLKAWNVRKDATTYLNRCVANNTLTDDFESLGKNAESLHPLVLPGVAIDLAGSKETLNGYVYPIGGMLLYNADVPQKVLFERMRIDWLSQLSEIMSNGWRYMYTNDVGKARIRFANDFFDDIRVYNGNNTHLGMNVRASLNTSSDKSYSLYQGDSFRGTGRADFAIKLPPVPEGDYELRLDFTFAGHFGIVQYYLGRTNDPNDMQTLDIPMDCRMDAADPRVGWSDPRTDETYETDKGYTADKDLRNRGWMRGLLSLVRENQKTSDDWIVRYRTDQIRRIVYKGHFDQGDYWLRVKSVLTDNPIAVFQLDYVEFVPLDLVQHPTLMEDMY